MFDAIADLVLSRACIGCDRLGPVMCPECWDRAVDVRTHRGRGAGSVPIIVGTTYGALVRDAVTALKDRGLLAMAEPIGGWLAVAVASAVPTASAIDLIPIPAHRASVAARGLDTLDRITRHAAEILREGGRSVHITPRLRRGIERGRQVGRDAEARRRSVAGTFCIRRDRWPRADHLVVVDDVVTTGATVREALRVLREAGIDVAAAAAACGTRRSGQSGEPGLDSLDDGIDP